jgi:hypothetical protein
MERIVESAMSASDEQVSIFASIVDRTTYFGTATGRFVTVKFQKRTFVGLFPGGGTVTGKGIAELSHKAT